MCLLNATHHTAVGGTQVLVNYYQRYIRQCRKSIFPASSPVRAYFAASNISCGWYLDDTDSVNLVEMISIAGLSSKHGN